MRASLFEVESTLRTWPQLASAVAFGGGLAADVARRILLGQLSVSGRFFVDPETLIADHVAPTSTTVPMTASASASRRARSLPPEQIRKLVAEASRAPSGGNRQPWRWVARGERLLLLADESRISGVTDFEGLGAIVALGAAAESLVLAAHRDGFEVRLAPFPEGSSSSTVASFEFEPGRDGDTTIRAGDFESHSFDALAQHLGERSTARHLGDRRPLLLDELGALTDAAESMDGVRLRLLTQRADIEAMAELIGKGDRLRLLDPVLLREMLSELRWSRREASESNEGLEVESLALSVSDRAGLEMCRYPESLALLSEWGLGRSLAKLGRKTAAASSALGLLTVESSRREAFFAGGRAMQRLWLTAHGLKLALHPVTFLPYAFARVRHAGGRGFGERTVRGLAELREPYARRFRLRDEGEVLLFRLSEAGPGGVRSLRRPVDEVLTFE
jgi:hypothetical protein